jgi:hypothetical protein
LSAAEQADRLWEYINCSQTHDCENWDFGRAIPLLGIFGSNYSVLVLCSAPNFMLRMPMQILFVHITISAFSDACVWSIGSPGLLTTLKGVVKGTV